MFRWESAFTWALSLDPLCCGALAWGKERLKARSKALCASVGLPAKFWGWVDKAEPAPGPAALAGSMDGAAEAAFAALVKVERVLGVMVAAEVEGVEVLLTIAARNAAVLGEGGGKEMPPPSGVSPVLKLERSGVKPVRKLLGSK